jgi:hypothetical protein
MSKDNVTAYILLGVCMISFAIGICYAFYHDYFGYLFLVLSLFSGFKSIDYRFKDDIKEIHHGK